MVPVALSRLLIRDMADMQLVELCEVDGDRRFPIVIGLPEAMAIERRCKGVSVERPQTHDLLSNTIAALGGTLARVELTDLQGGTFFARLVVDQGGREVEIDCRPSDAIALAAAGNVPIFAAESVIEEAAIDLTCPDSIGHSGESSDDEPGADADDDSDDDSDTDSGDDSDD